MKEFMAKIGTLKGDRAIWVILLCFAMISLAVVYSSTSALAFRLDQTPFHYLINQLVFYIIGFGILLICYRIPLKFYRTVSYLVMGIAIMLLFVPLLTKNLRSFEIMGVGIHPAEIAKVATVLYLARIIEVSKLDTFKEYTLKILLPIGLTCALSMMGSMSAALIIFLIALIILVCSGIRPKFILMTVPIAIGVVAVAFSVSILTHGKVFSRFSTFTERIERFFKKDTAEMTPEETAKFEAMSFQGEQAREAIQLGGLFGRGPGNSLKRDTLPNAYDDYIFSIIVEEYGLIFGGIPIIVLYLWFFFRCLKIARSCTTKFPMITVLGLSTLITMQAFLHIFVNTGIVPVTGQTLPMISRGGTALVIMSSAFGIILSVNRTIVIKDMKLKAQKEAQSCSTES